MSVTAPLRPAAQTSSILQMQNWCVPSIIDLSGLQKLNSKWHRIKIVAPTGEELERLRQAVELDRELLSVRKQLFELEKQRNQLSTSGRCVSPYADQSRECFTRHVCDRNDALSEEHVRSYAAFDEAVLTMRRGYSLETAAVMRGTPDDRCDPFCIHSDHAPFPCQPGVRASTPHA